MSKMDKVIAYEEFVKDLKECYDSLKYYTELLGYDTVDEIKMVDSAMNEFKSLVETLENVESLKEAKKYAKLKKIEEYYTDDEQLKRLMRR